MAPLQVKSSIFLAKPCSARPLYFARSSAPNQNDISLIDRIAEKAVSYALAKTSGVAALSDESNQIECIDFEKIKGGKPFDYNQQWFNDMLIKIGQKR